MVGWLFYGILTFIGYLKPNPVYTYILDIYVICKRIVLSVTIFTWASAYLFAHS